MTAQVVLLNIHGLAFATDSATTFGNGTVYNGADKVTVFPGRHKIAILHAGAVGMHNVTHLQLLEQWMQEIGDDTLPTVRDYAASYLQWLTLNGKRFITNEAAEGSIVSVIRAAFRAAASEMNEMIEERATDKHSAQELGRKCLEIVDETISILDELPEPVGFSPIWADTVLRKLTSQIETAADVAFQNIPKARGFKSAVHTLAHVALARSPHTTRGTLTFTGYGHDEFAPALVQLELGLLHENTLLYRRNEDIYFDPNRSPHIGIVVVGHEATIDLVLHGYNDSVVETAIDAVTHQSNASREAAEAEVNALFERQQWMKRADRVLPTLAALPISTLAFVAGQLVGLEALEKILTAQNPTVGGDVKVWTITKSAGCLQLTN